MAAPATGFRRLRTWLLVGWAYLAGRARAGWRRVQGAALPMLQASVAAALAWVLAADIVGRPAPIVAPIAAWVGLGFKPDRMPRQVAELGAGATLGVVIGDIAASSGTIGPVQLVVLLLVAGLLARFLDSGDLFTIQTTINAVVVFGLWNMGVANVQDRWIDALCGAGVAFVFAVLMERRPTTRAVRYVRSSTREFALLLDKVALAMRSEEADRLRELAGQRDALVKLLDESDTTVRAARSLVRVNPTLRAFRTQAAELARDQRLVLRAVRTTDVIVRQAVGMIEDDERGLDALSVPVARLAAATHTIAGNIGAREAPLAARADLLDLAASAVPEKMVGSGGWRSLVLAGIILSLTVDLLQLTGLSRSAARAALARVPEPKASAVPADPLDGSSRVWGTGLTKPADDAP